MKFSSNIEWFQLIHTEKLGLYIVVNKFGKNSFDLIKM